jgi:hypothetical protein
MHHAFQGGRGLATAPKQAFTDTMLSTAGPERRVHLDQTTRVYEELYAELAQKAAAEKTAEAGALTPV